MSNGDVLGQRHEQQQDEQQYHRMYHAGYGRLTAVVNVGHRTCNGSRSGDTAEERCYHIGYTLGNEFGVRVMFVANHTVGYSSREQRLDGAQHSNGHGYRKEVLHRLPIQCRDSSVGQLGADAETVADGVDAGDAAVSLHQPDGHGYRQ